MKIAIDISPLSSGHSVRGVGFYLKNLLAALKKYYPDNEYIEFTKKSDIPKDTDIVHYPYFDPFLVTLPISGRKNSVVTVHDLTPLVLSSLFPVGIKGKLFWQIQKYLLKKMNIVITDSLSSKADVQKLVGLESSKVKSVPLAAAEHFKIIENKSFLTSLRKKYNLPEHFSLYVGDVTPNKNLPNLVKASLRTKTPLVMVGKTLSDTSVDLSHPWTRDLSTVLNLVRANSDKVKILGFVKDEDLVGIYNLADVFLMPSLYEGFGLPILEAFSCGTPVITTNKGSLKEVAGNGAYLVNPENIEEMVQGIEKIVGDKKFAKSLSVKGFAQAKKFSWKKTAGETIAAYKMAS